jgi:spermidine/putrescine transport system substrate-binding protein
VPTDYLVTVLRRENLLAPLNKDNLPNFENLDPRFINPTLDPGNRFCIPYLWGTTALGYNLKATGKEITSWKDVFGPANVRRVALLDGARESLGLALLALIQPQQHEHHEITAPRLFDRSFRSDRGNCPGYRSGLARPGQGRHRSEYSGDIFR